MPTVKNIKHDAIDNQKQNLKELSVTDSEGRHIVVRKLRLIDQFEMTKLLGADAENTTYFTQCLVLCCVKELDGVPISINSKNEMNDLIKRLDFEGYKAVADAVGELSQTLNEEEAKTVIKK